MEKQLTKEQYEQLMQEETNFITVVRSAYMKNINGNWLNTVLKPVYGDIFGQNVNTNCNSCIMEAMNRLWHKIQDYRVAEELLKTADEPGKHGKPKKVSN